MAVAMLMSIAVAGAGSSPQSDLDQFMFQVLARRDDNWKKLQQYVLEEREAVDVTGSNGARLWGQRRDHTWFMRDGVFVRSPLRVDGVAVPEPERRAREDDFVKSALEREKRGDAASAPAAASGDSAGSVEGLLSGGGQPRFVDSAYFLRFKFEPGRYALVGRESFEGRQALRIEYYPERLFTGERERRGRGSREGGESAGEGAKDENAKDDDGDEEDEKDSPRAREVAETTRRMMNKVALVTLWVDPAAHQILKYTFDNVDFDFLPAAWFLRVTNVQATMTMGQPFPDVWLPRSVEMRFGAMLASGAVDFRYLVEYHDYREATTDVRIKIPGQP